MRITHACDWSKWFIQLLWLVDNTKTRLAAGSRTAVQTADDMNTECTVLFSLAQAHFAKQIISMQNKGCNSKNANRQTLFLPSLGFRAFNSIFGHIPHNSPLSIGKGIRILNIKCHEAKKWQKHCFAICIFAVTPFTYGQILMLVKEEYWTKLCQV